MASTPWISSSNNFGNCSEGKRQFLATARRPAAARWDTDQFVFRRGGGESLHGEVGDAVERQVHQLTPEVVLVEVAEEGLVSELDDGVDQVAGGLVLQKHHQWTKKTKKGIF